MKKNDTVSGEYKIQLVRERDSIVRWLAIVDSQKARASSNDSADILLKMIEYDEECKAARMVEINTMLSVLS